MSTTIYFFSRNKKNNVYPYKPQFYCIKVGFKVGGGSKLYRHDFVMRGEIQLMAVWCFIAQRLLLSPLHCVDMI